MGNVTRTDQHRGTASQLARWFAASDDISFPEAGEQRDQILGDLYSFDQFATTDGKIVLLGTKNGRGLLKPNDTYPDSVITIVYAPHGSDRLVSFWMNRSSLTDLIEQLTDLSKRGVDFDELLANERVPAAV